jgi:hypothetical protein
MGAVFLYVRYRLLQTRHETRPAFRLLGSASTSLMIASDRLSPPPAWRVAGQVDQHFAGLARRILGDHGPSSASSK